MTKAKYTKYIDSKVSWLGMIPEHWEVRRIKYVFKELDSRSKTGKEDLLSVSQYTGVTRKSDKVSEGESISNAKTLEGYKIVAKGNLVINIMLAWNGSLGISKYDGIVSPAYCVYKNLIGDEGYFGYLFKTKNAQKEFKKQSTGIIDSRLRMYTNSFFNIKTVLPPKQEQITIADFLDYKTEMINRFIKKKKQLIKLLNEQKAAIINQAVTKGLDTNVEMKDSGIEWLGEIPEHWECWKMSRAYKYFGSGTTPKSGLKKYYENGTIPWVNTGDLNNGILNECEQKITDLAIKDYSVLKTYPKGTISIAMYGASIGKISIVDFKFTSNQACCNINTSKILFDNFTFYWFIGNKARIVSLGYGGTQPNISQNLVKSLKITVPPKTEQKQIVHYIETETQKIDKTISTIKKEITLVEEYKTALIAEAVTGKIDVRSFKLPDKETPLAMVAEEGEKY